MATGINEGRAARILGTSAGQFLPQVTMSWYRVQRNRMHMAPRTYVIVRQPETLAARVEGRDQSVRRDASRARRGRLNREQPHA
jgi:hypothetical protein